MPQLRKPVYFAAGSYTVSMGTGRKEFHPKKPRPGLDDYIKEAGQATINLAGGDAAVIDEGVIGNFVGSRFNRQSHLAAMLPAIDSKLLYKPSIRVEGACATGGLALTYAMRSVLADLADVVLVLGVEVQNTVKAMYCADYLAEAGHAPDRKNGDAYYFPGKFANRAGAYYEKFGEEQTRKAMAKWFEQAIVNARTCPQAQEYHNKHQDLLALGMSKPNPRSFLPNINVFDCSKVSDGAAAMLCLSEKGLEKLGIAPEKAVKVKGFGQVEADLTQAPEDLTQLTTSRQSVQNAYEMAGISAKDLGLLEVHDCFTITGLLMLEAAGLADYGKAPEYLLSNATARDSQLPTNTTGGLIGYGHPTGATGVRQMVDLWKQLTDSGEQAQVKIAPERPYGLMINMGGDDRTVVSFVVQRGDAG